MAALRFPAQIPLLAPTLSLTSGIILSALPINLWIAISFAAIIAFISIVCRRLTFAMLAIIFIAGFIEARVFAPQNLSNEITNKSIYRSGLITEVIDSDNCIVADVDMDSLGMNPGQLNPCAKIRLRLIIPDNGYGIMPRGRITWSGKIVPVKAHKNNSASIDYDRFLWSKGISGKCFVRSDDIISVSEPTGVIASISKIRTDIERVLFDDSALTDGAKTFIAAAVLGDISFIDDETRDRFSMAGIAHILAISGTHIAVIIMLLNMALLPLNYIKSKYIKITLTIGAIWFYACFTGLAPSAVRASIMATVFMPALVIQRRYSPANTLCLAAIILLLYRPYLLFDMGAQLSFGAVAGILLLGDNLISFINKKRRLVYGASRLLSTSISAVIAAAPIAAYYIHSLPLLFIPAALIATLLLPALFISVVALIASALLGWDISIITTTINAIYEIIDRVVRLIAELPFSAIDKLYFNAWCLLPWYMGILSMAAWLRSRRPAFLWASILSVILSGMLISLSARPQQNASEFVIDSCHKGTALIIRNGRQTYVSILTSSRDTASLIEDVKTDFADFAAMNGADSIVELGNKFLLNPFYRNCNIIGIGEKILVIVSGSHPPLTLPGARVNYALIGGDSRFHSTIAHIEALRPDTVILGADINKRRLNRYTSECDSAGYPIIDMRDISEWRRSVEITSR